MTPVKVDKIKSDKICRLFGRISLIDILTARFTKFYILYSCIYMEQSHLMW